MPSGYRAYKSPDAATGTGTFNVVDVGGSVDHVMAEIVITGTATVALDGSLDGMTFVTVASGLTASTIYQLDHRVPFYRARVTAYSNGTVTVEYGPGEGRLGELQSMSPPMVIAGGPQ